MKLNEIMTSEVEAIRVNDSLQMAAQKMRDRNIGFLPVFDGDQLIGVLTDRDLALRGIANGMNSKAMLGRDLVTSPAIHCFDDQDVSEAVRLMHDNQIRRLVIFSRGNNQLVGVISLGDLVGVLDNKFSGELVQSVSEPVKSI